MWQSPDPRAKGKWKKQKQPNDLKERLNKKNQKPHPNPPKRPLLTTNLLPAKSSTGAHRISASIRGAIRRLGEDGRTVRRRRRAKRVRRRIRQTEPPLTERVPIDLAEIIADEAIPLVRILELQNIRAAADRGDFDRVATVAGGGVGFRVCASGGGERDGGTTSGGVLLADGDVGGESALVDDDGLTWGAGARVSGSEGGCTCGDGRWCCPRP